MRLGSIRARCTRLLADLGVDGPTGVDWLAEHLGARRGRPVHLLAQPQLGEPSGMWVAGAHADYVFYDEALTGLHREHVIAHELAHIAFGHGHEHDVAPQITSSLLPDLDPKTLRTMLERGSYNDVEEREAEVFASLLMQVPIGPRIDDLPDAVRDQALGMARTFGSRRDGLR